MEIKCLDEWNEIETALNINYLIEQIKNDRRYQKCVAWGKSRPGHEEGSIAAHIEELERNLEIVQSYLDSLADQSVLSLLIHTHDTFKSEAKKGVPITHPESHASLAREYVEAYLGVTYLSNMLQYHDELYAIWRKAQSKSGIIDQQRLDKLIALIEDWDLFMTFNIIDNTTKSKDFEPTQWAITVMTERVHLSLNHREMFNKIIQDLANR